MSKICLLVCFFVSFFSFASSDQMTEDDFYNLVGNQEMASLLRKDLDGIYSICENYYNDLNNAYKRLIKDDCPDVVHDEDKQNKLSIDKSFEKMDRDFIKKSILLVFWGIDPSLDQLQERERIRLNELLGEIRQLRWQEYDSCCKLKITLRDELQDIDNQVFEKINSFESEDGFFKKIKEQLKDCSTKYGFFIKAFGNFRLFNPDFLEIKEGTLEEVLKQKTAWQKVCFAADRLHYNTLCTYISKKPSAGLFIDPKTAVLESL